MLLNLIGPFQINAPFGTEIAFAKGLRRIGHEVIEVDPNIDREMCGLRNDADATVVFKSCVGSEKYLKSLRHPIVVYQPDDARFPHIKQMMLDMRQYARLFLSFDDYGAGVALTMGYRAAETLLLTADDELYCPSPSPIERDIDVSFIGSLGDPVAHRSRRRMCEFVDSEAGRRGWQTWFGTTQDVATIVDVYRRSKVVLNHATDVGQAFGTGYGLQCRHFEVGMTRTSLISNSLFGPQTYRAPLPFYQFHDDESLIYGIEAAIGGDVHQVWGECLYGQIAMAHLPQHRAAELVNFIERNS
jgi:hypothetical protein